MKSIYRSGSGVAIVGFLLIVFGLNSNASAQLRNANHRQRFQRIYGQEDTYSRTRRATRQQRRSNRARLRSLKYQSYNGSGFYFSYGRSGRYGYSSYVDRSAYNSSYYRPWNNRPWYNSPYSFPTYYFGFYGRGYYGYGNYSYRSYGYQSYGNYRPGYYRGYGFGHAPY